MVRRRKRPPNTPPFRDNTTVARLVSRARGVTDVQCVAGQCRSWTPRCPTAVPGRTTATSTSHIPPRIPHHRFPRDKHPPYVPYRFPPTDGCLVSRIGPERHVIESTSQGLGVPDADHTRGEDQPSYTIYNIYNIYNIYHLYHIFATPPNRSMASVALPDAPTECPNDDRRYVSVERVVVGWEIVCGGGVASFGHHQTIRQNLHQTIHQTICQMCSRIRMGYPSPTTGVPSE